MKPVLAFDLHGTLTDTTALNPYFTKVFGSATQTGVWFSQMVNLAMATSMTGVFVAYPTLALAALQMVADRSGVTLNDQERSELTESIRNLPLFPDVKPALQQIASTGFRMALLTNTPRAADEATLKHLGIGEFFEQVLSVEMVQCYKPAPQVYLAGAKSLKVAPGDMMMVTAHNIDTTGAIRAGCQAAFITRPGEVLAPTDPKPGIVAKDLHDFTDTLAMINT
jgi:2-haloacid dehalogenase